MPGLPQVREYSLGDCPKDGDDGPAEMVALLLDGPAQGAEMGLQPGAHQQHWMAVLHKFNQLLLGLGIKAKSMPCL